MSLGNYARAAIRKITAGVRNLTGGGQSLVDSDELWKFCNDLWDAAKNKEKDCETGEKYWEGKLSIPLSQQTVFKDQTHSNDNIIQPITETLLSNILDAQFEIAVVPAVGSFFDMNATKDCRAVADILNDAIREIEESNQSEITDECVLRDGMNCALGSSLSDWSTKDNPQGDVIIEHIPAKDLRFIDKVLFAYRKEYSVQEAKELFCKDENGDFVEELCREIDDISEVKIGSKDRKYSGAVINYVDNNSAGQAFASKGYIGGIQAGRVVNFITLYLLDDSCYAPDEDDDTQKSEMKQTFKKAFPNGRKIVFNAENNDKLILCDEPLPENFKNLGNIDVFNPIVRNGLEGATPIKPLYPIQDRIDALYAKYRIKVGWDIDTRIVDSDFIEDDSALANSPITKVEGFNDRKGVMSEPLTNNGIEKGKLILEAIKELKESAYEKAGLNQTMMSGYRQTGTNSAEQVEALQESPMVKIRRIQRNFINYKIARAEKILNFVLTNYSDQRFIQLSAGIDGAKIAQIKTDSQSNQKTIALLKEVKGVVSELRSISFNDKWKFRCKCTAGTGIARSRKELAKLTDVIAASPVMASGDLDMIEMYLDAQDYPQRRALMTLLRNKQEQAQNPVTLTKTKQANLISVPAQGETFAKVITALAGYPAAQQQLLRNYGLIGETGTITSLPANEVTSKTSALDIASVAPAQVSDKPAQAVFGNKVAEDIKMAELKPQTRQPLEVLQ